MFGYTTAQTSCLQLMREVTCSSHALRWCLVPITNRAGPNQGFAAGSAAMCLQCACKTSIQLLRRICSQLLSENRASQGNSVHIRYEVQIRKKLMSEAQHYGR